MEVEEHVCGQIARALQRADPARQHVGVQRLLLRAVPGRDAHRQHRHAGARGLLHQRPATIQYTSHVRHIHTLQNTELSIGHTLSSLEMLHNWRSLGMGRTWRSLGTRCATDSVRSSTARTAVRRLARAGRFGSAGCPRCTGRTSAGWRSRRREPSPSPYPMLRVSVENVE